MFLSSLLKCVPLRFGLPPHFHVIQKKKKKKGAVKDPSTANMKERKSTLKHF